MSNRFSHRLTPHTVLGGQGDRKPGGEGASAFDPASINDHLWLNSVGLTLNGSDEVTVWADQVGSLNLSAGTGKEIPTTASDANFSGTRSLQFRATNTTSLTSGVTNLDLSGVSSWSFWAVMRKVGTGTQIVFEQSASASANPGFLWAWVSNKWRSELNATNLNRADSVAVASTSAMLFIGDHDTALSGGSVSEGVPYEDNVAKAMSLVTAGNASGNGASNILYIGARGGGSLYADFDLVAMGLKKTKFSASERAQMQTWAESLYGI